MPKEIVTLQVGQCGNQVGLEFWKRLCAEHGIREDGTANDAGPEDFVDRKDIFFYQADDCSYLPRSILVDLEPRVIERIQAGEYRSLFNPENVFVGGDGGGAGNNWAKGYDEALAVSETVMEKIEREAENTDSLEAFMLCHSISGGTGAGLGSFLLEQLQDLYPKKLLWTYSVFPDQSQSEDVVVAPYNSILTMKRLVQCADAVVVLDNAALDRIVSGKLGVPSPTMEDANSLVSTIMAASTATLRLPGPMFNSLASIAMTTCPSANCHFLVSGYTPLTVRRQENVVRKTSVFEVIRRLLQYENWMVSIAATLRDQGLQSRNRLLEQSRYAGALISIQGEADSSEVYKSLTRIQEKHPARFVAWGPAGFQVAHTVKSPHIDTEHRVSGLLLASHTGIRHLFGSTLRKFSKMFERQANVHTFTQYPNFRDGLSAFTDAEDVVKCLIDEYKECESSDLPSWLPQ